MVVRSPCARCRHSDAGQQMLPSVRTRLLLVHFPLTLLLVQNTTAAIVILITAMAMKLAGKSRMEPFTASQIIIVLGSAAVSTLQLAASLIALPHISIATLTVFGNGR